MQTNDIVSKFFIGQYYQTLCQDYKSMSKFYASDCTLSFSVEKDLTKSVFGSDKIVALFEECGLQESVVNLDNGHMNYVATENGGMIILVSGQMSLSDQKERQFSQAFLLVKIGECYAIKSDMLQLMEVPELYVEQEVEEEEEVETPEPVPEVVQEFIPSFPQPEEETAKKPAPVEEVAEPEPEPVAPVVEEAVPEVPEPLKEMEAPEEEVKPEAPVVPEVPETPEAPKAPEAPEALKTSEVPKVPEAPEVANTPKAPEAPKTPKSPKAPEAHETKKEHMNRYPNRRNNHRSNRVVKKEEQDDDGFSVVKTNYTKKANICGSSLFVKYDSKSINKEALINLFKNEGTVVKVFTNDARLFAFVDFSEKDAAANAIEKAREQPFRLGNVTLNVSLNRKKSDHVSRIRPALKKE